MTMPNKEDEMAGTEQPFVAHLMELRDRLLYCLYGIIIATMILAIYPGPSGMIDLVAKPIMAHMPAGSKLIAVGVFSPFFVPLKVLMMGSVLLALPWLMYQMWMFVAPGLYSHEKKFAFPMIIMGSILAYTGIAFVQFLVLDKMFEFLQKFTPASVSATPDVASYVETILGLYIAFGLAFQVPIIVILLTRFNMVTVKQLKEYRGYFLVGATVFAAIVTPPDIASQIALAGAMYVLYEAGIIAATYFVKAGKPPEEADSTKTEAS